MTLSHKITLAIGAILAIAPMHSRATTSDIMWYNTPAKEWMEGAPMGNGRIGTIVYGGIHQDKIALNEVTLWAGQRDEQQNDHCGPEKLKEIRQAFFDGDLEKGNQLTNTYLRGFSQSFGTHLPLGDMVMEFDYPDKNITDYRRELDLSTAVATTSLKSGGVTYKREYICNYPNDVFAVQITADKPGSINMKLSTDLLRKADIKANGKCIDFEGKVDYPMFGPGGVEFAGKFQVETKDGKIEAKDNALEISDASKVTIIFDVRTDFDNPTYKSQLSKNIEKACTKDFEVLKKENIADHQALYRKMDLVLEPTSNSTLPTDMRLRLAKEGSVDPDFDALFFKYGRYMQIASSRPNSPLASNLQGIWNDNLACQMSWTCDYHLDININQNYWSPNRANLHECNVPMFKYVALLQKYGSETASKLYGCKGWCAHTITNPWGYTAPGGDVSWGLNVSAGAWLATELWSHYLYTLDTDYLRETGYPLLKSCAEFFVDYMVEDPNTGYLVTGPSISPENGFRTADGKHYSASMMPALDRQIVYQIYTACIESSKILGIDKKFRKQLEKDIKRLPPNAIGADGQVKEWLLDVSRSDPSHRHSSHLMGLYPFGQMTYTSTPELMEAAKKSLAAQTASEGWEDTEWSSANMLCFQAYLKDGDKAHGWLQNLFKTFTRENLMTVSPKGVAGAPEDIFSFDATEASVAGICDMLIQSHDGFIELLPALPSAWKKGSVKGVCAQGALEADIDWTDNAIAAAEIRANKDTAFKIIVPDNTTLTTDGKMLTSKKDNNGLTEISLKAGQKVNIKTN